MKHSHTMTCPDCGFTVNHACEVFTVSHSDSGTAQVADKVVSVRRSSRAPAQRDTIPVRDSTTPDTGVTPVVSTPEVTVVPEEEVTYYTHVMKRGRGNSSHYSGSGSKSGKSKKHNLSLRSDNQNNETIEQFSFVPPDEPPAIEPPERLREFATLLGRSSKFHPTQRYYDRLMHRYGNIPYLDFAEQAEKMIEWFRDHKSKYHELTDLCRFSERWMVIAADEAGKIARANGVYRNNGQAQKRPGDTLRMGGGLSDDQLASADEMSKRGRSHYDE